MTIRPDRAPKTFWDGQWRAEPIPRPVDPGDRGLRNTVRRAFHSFFSRLFAGLHGKPDVALLEVGCGRSIWLPYFARQFDFCVTGIDYSDSGCDKSREILATEQVAGLVLQQDMFQPSGDLVGRYDVVVSFGLVEHFDDPVAAVRALAAFLKPGGLLITNIPNMKGATGLVQRTFNSAVYKQHIPHTVATLAAAHASAGLNVQECRYFMSTGFNVCNFQRPGHPRVAPVARLAKLILTSFSVGIWFLERLVGAMPVSRTFSPYVNCVAVKPADRN